MGTFVIGIDLNETTSHEVLVTNESNERIHRQKVSSDFEELEKLLDTVEEMISPQDDIVVVLEATGMAWFSVSAFFELQGIDVYRVKGQRSSDLRKFLEKHSKTDTIDARAISMVYHLIPDKLNKLNLPDPERHALKRWVSRREHYKEQLTAEKNRVQSFLRWALPSWDGNTSWFTGKKMRQVLPKLVNYDWMQKMGPNRFYRWAKRRNGEMTQKEADELYEASVQAAKYYGDKKQQYYFPQELQEEANSYLQQLEHLEEQIQEVEKKIKELYRRVLADKPLGSLPGTRWKTGAVLKSYLGDGSHFPNRDCAEAFVGSIPKTDSSGDTDKKGTTIRKDGPSILKNYLYLATDTARQYDPQIAARYHKEMVEKGNPHTKAICNTINNYLGRVLRVLRDGEPYQLRDCDGNPVTSDQARQMIKEKYTVPREVRERLRDRSTSQ